MRSSIPASSRGWLSLPAGVLSVVTLLAPLASAQQDYVSSATPVSRIKVKEGFKVELLYSVPGKAEGSWVAMTTDNKGRLIASDQNGGLFRIVPPAIGGPASDTKVEKLPIDMGHANGLLWAFDSLYVMVCKEKVYQGSGVYRLQDTTGDGELDKVTQVVRIEGESDHGPHAMLLSPDGKSITIVCGNRTVLPEMQESRVPRIWKEDDVLPRVYGRGFMRDTGPPGGFIAKISPDGKDRELLAMGFRNEYDAAWSRDGELFTYDADMEWDVNTPWYRPTRVCLVQSGAEFGWRNCSAKFRAWYPDNLPGVLDIGPGSPTGVVFGYGAKFPAHYQDSLFIADWSYGKIYAVTLKPDGASWTGEREEIVSAQPLPVTDMVIRQDDGAMYFAIGGRQAQSGLYRLTWTGSESTAPIASVPVSEGAEMRTLRRSLEQYHGHADPAAVAPALANLGHADRSIRFAARTALEFQPVASWGEQALAATEPTALIHGALAVSRAGDASWQGRILEALGRLAGAGLTEAQSVDALRTLGVCLSRMGDPAPDVCQAIASHLAAGYPTNRPRVDYELCQLLVRLQSADVPAKTLPILLAAPTQEEQIGYAVSLRLAKNGWTPELREQFFRWMLRAQTYKGGASFTLFIKEIKDGAIATLTDAEKTALQPLIDAVPDAKDPGFTYTPREFVKAWTTDELAPKVDALLKAGGRDFARGRNLFGATTCYACHRFNEEGGAVGPDLSAVGGRFGVRDLLESVLEPSKVISDQYEAIIVTKKDGSTVVGRIANLNGDTVQVMTNMMDPGQMDGVKRRDVQSIEPSPVSMMPPGLINTLQPEEVADLMAWLISGGNEKADFFKKP